MAVEAALVVTTEEPGVGSHARRRKDGLGTPECGHPHVRGGAHDVGMEQSTRKGKIIEMMEKGPRLLA